MPSKFIEGFASEGHLTADERALFSALNIQTADELLAVVWNFRGCLSEQNFNLARISGAAANQSSAGFIRKGQQSGAVGGTPPQFARGADYPGQAPADVGFSAPPTAGSGRGGGAGAGGPLDFRMTGWPVRDQGVAHLASDREGSPSVDADAHGLCWPNSKRGFLLGPTSR